MALNCIAPENPRYNASIAAKSRKKGGQEENEEQEDDEIHDSMDPLLGHHVDEPRVWDAPQLTSAALETAKSDHRHR
jgi:hypothetical protein